jgi:hypothetical protein
MTGTIRTRDHRAAKSSREKCSTDLPALPGSQERSLAAARGRSEHAGQMAAREMELVGINGALHRAEELSDDVSLSKVVADYSATLNRDCYLQRKTGASPRLAKHRLGRHGERIHAGNSR